MTMLLTLLVIALAWLIVGTTLYGLSRSVRRLPPQQHDIFLDQLHRLNDETERRRKETLARLTTLRDTVRRGLHG